MVKDYSYSKYYDKSSNYSQTQVLNGLSKIIRDEFNIYNMGVSIKNSSDKINVNSLLDIDFNYNGFNLSLKNVKLDDAINLLYSVTHNKEIKYNNLGFVLSFLKNEKNNFCLNNIKKVSFDDNGYNIILNNGSNFFVRNDSSNIVSIDYLTKCISLNLGGSNSSLNYLSNNISDDDQYNVFYDFGKLLSSFSITRDDLINIDVSLYENYMTKNKEIKIMLDLAKKYLAYAYRDLNFDSSSRNDVNSKINYLDKCISFIDSFNDTIKSCLDACRDYDESLYDSIDLLINQNNFSNSTNVKVVDAISYTDSMGYASLRGGDSNYYLNILAQGVSNGYINFSNGIYSYVGRDYKWSYSNGKWNFIDKNGNIYNNLSFSWYGSFSSLEDVNQVVTMSYPNNATNYVKNNESYNDQLYVIPEGYTNPNSIGGQQNKLDNTSLAITGSTLITNDLLRICGNNYYNNTIVSFSAGTTLAARSVISYPNLYDEFISSNGSFNGPNANGVDIRDDFLGACTTGNVHLVLVENKGDNQSIISGVNRTIEMAQKFNFTDIEVYTNSSNVYNVSGITFTRLSNNSKILSSGNHASGMYNGLVVMNQKRNNNSYLI